MKIELSSASPEPSDVEISSVSKSLGFSLPAEYLNLLSKINGAAVAPNMFDIFGASDQSGVTKFITFSDIPREAEITGTLRMGKIFPVAIAESGDRICISADHDDKGSVYFWDHERAEVRDDLVFLSKSLCDFLELLRPFDNNSVKLQPDQIKRAWINPKFLKNH